MGWNLTLAVIAVQRLRSRGERRSQEWPSVKLSALTGTRQGPRRAHSGHMSARDRVNQQEESRAKNRSSSPYWKATQLVERPSMLSQGSTDASTLVAADGAAVRAVNFPVFPVAGSVSVSRFSWAPPTTWPWEPK